MQKIGNIVTQGNKNIYNQLFNVVKSLSEIDNDLPTLIIDYIYFYSIVLLYYLFFSYFKNLHFLYIL